MFNQQLENFRQRISSEYMKALALPPNYKFLDGTPVAALPPRQTTPNSIMIVGAYPAARYEKVQGEPFVPVGNIDQPFDSKAWAGDELDKVYLQPLGLTRQQCWITNLVRCYLFEEKGGKHKRDISKYRKLGADWPEFAVRERFDEYARQGLPWLEEELRLAQPKLVITLGSEVAAAFHPGHPKTKRTALVEDAELRQVKLGDYAWTMVHLAHPGAGRGEKWKKRVPEQLQKLKATVQKLIAES
jgi:uracil-DNA glycosylase